MINEIPTIPEIQNLATGRPYTDKQGLQFVQASRLLKMCRTSAFYINNKEATLNDDAMIMQLYAYVESALPVIIGVDVADLKWWKTVQHCYHSLVVIGHTMKDNKVDGFIVHDESALPYQVMTEKELRSAWHKPERPKKKSITQQEKPQQEMPSEDHVRELLVAVPPEVSLPFHEAYHGFYSMLNTLHDLKIIDEDVNDFQFRPKLTSPTLLYFETKNDLLFDALREAGGFPKFIWTMHFMGKGEDRNKFKGFFVRDATRRTKFIFAYVKDKGTAIYQIDEGKTYQRWDNKRNRKWIKGTA